MALTCTNKGEVMKAGSRKFIKDVELKSIEGETHSFDKDGTVVAEIVSRRNGICKLVGICDNETFTCKAIRGNTNIV